MSPFEETVIINGLSKIGEGDSNMVPIKICEDNLFFQRLLQDELEKYIMINHYDFQVTLATDNPRTLLADLSENNQQGIYFLDVELQDEGYDGFKLGKEIRARDPRGFIVYVTTHEELAFETFRYRVEAMDYVIKDDEQQFIQRLHRCLDSIVERLAAQQVDNRPYYTVKVFDEVYHVPVAEITMIETSSQKHRLIVHTATQSLEFFASLTEVAKELGDPFLRVHRSFLVNRQHIQSLNIKDNRLALKNNLICEVSRTKKKELQRLLKENTLNEAE